VRAERQPKECAVHRRARPPAKEPERHELVGEAAGQLVGYHRVGAANRLPSARRGTAVGANRAVGLAETRGQVGTARVEKVQVLAACDGGHVRHLIHGEEAVTEARRASADGEGAVGRWLLEQHELLAPDDDAGQPGGNLCRFTGPKSAEQQTGKRPWFYAKRNVGVAANALCQPVVEEAFANERFMKEQQLTCGNTKEYVYPYTRGDKKVSGHCRELAGPRGSRGSNAKVEDVQDVATQPEADEERKHQDTERH
jgi:hypothetical protein